MEKLLGAKNTVSVLLFFMLGGAAWLANSEPQDNDRISIIIEQAKGGDAKSALWLSRYYDGQSGMEVDARKWLHYAAELGSIVAIAELGYDNPYMSETNFRCGSYEVKISTSCSSVDKTEALPLCYAQHVELKLDNTRRDFFIFNPEFRVELMVAYRATCINSKEKTYMILESSNFGSGRTCVDCEREDYFDGSANYIGSSQGGLGKKLVHEFVVIPKATENKIQEAVGSNVVRKEVFEISRYPIIEREWE